MTKVECRTTALAACATVSMAEAKATHSTTPAEGVIREEQKIGWLDVAMVLCVLPIFASRQN